MPELSSQQQLKMLAERQEGVVWILQLHEIGFTRQQIETMVRRGQLHRLFRGVYAVGHTRLSVRGRLIAAQFAAGEGAFLSHRTGAAARRLRGAHNLRRIELTVAANRTPARRPGLVVHRTTTPIDRAEARPYNGLLTATVPRLLIDLAAVEPPKELLRLIGEAVHTNQFDSHALEAALVRHRGRRGLAVLKAAADWYRPGPDRKSDLERSFQRHQRSDPRLPVPEYNQFVLGWEIDVMWRAQGVCLELDGRNYHTVMKEFDRDHRKDRKLSIHGLRPVRVSDFEWEHDRASVLADLYALLGV